MNLTTLFRLRKPEGTDPVNIEDFNDNFDVIDTELGKRPLKTDPASDMTVVFTQASSRTNLTTGEKLSVSLGKIMKFFADLKTVAFSGSYEDLSNKPTIPSGTAANCQVVDDVDDIKAITESGYVPGTLALKQVIIDLSAVQQSFQDGVNTLYNKCVSCGVTPAAKTPAAIATAIQTIYTNRYNDGKSDGIQGVSVTFSVYGEDGGMYGNPRTHTVAYGTTGDYASAQQADGGLCKITSWSSN